MISDFYDLIAWKESHKLVIMIYKAEGFGRYSYKDRNHFNYQARGSAKEVQDFLLISRDLKIINESQFKETWEQVKKAEMLINGLIRSTDKLK